MKELDGATADTATAAHGALLSVVNVVVVDKAVAQRDGGSLACFCLLFKQPYIESNAY